MVARRKAIVSLIAALVPYLTDKERELYWKYNGSGQRVRAELYLDVARQRKLDNERRGK